MKIFDTVCEKIGIRRTEEEAYEESEMASESKEEVSSRYSRPEMQPSNVVAFRTAANSREALAAASRMNVVVIAPRNFDDAQHVADCLREKRPALINFENTDSESARRIVDFISGTVYALEGTMGEVGRNVFLCAPSNVSVTNQEKKRSSIDPMWREK